MLLALDAGVEIVGTTGTRRVPLDEFLVGSYETTLGPGEIVTAIRIPPPPAGAIGRYLKFTTRSSEDRPSAGVAVLVRTSGGAIDDVRIVVGAISPRPVRVDVADIARGETISPPLIAAMAAAAAATVEPVEDLRGSVAYKRRLTEVLTRRLLTESMQAAVA